MARDRDEPPNEPPWDDEEDLTPTSVTRPIPRIDEPYGYVDEPVVEEEEIVEEPPRRRPPLLWPYLLALLVLVLVGLGALWYFTQEDEPETKPVPAVVRLTEGDAVQRLNDEGFQSAIEREPSDEVPQGIVFAQRPGAGNELEEGSTVTILVASGAATVEVPDVTGLPRERAEQQLADAGLRANVAQVFSEEEPGTVVAQDPAAGERAEPDSSVRINVSQGTGRVEVPDVVGMSAADAGAALRTAGLATPNVVSVPSARPANEVVAQNPAAGTEVQRGTKIRINVSNGEGGTPPPPQSVELPDVVGLPEDEAVRLLEDAGATVSIVRDAVSEPDQDGIVQRQEPAGGEQIEPDGDVEIVVGSLTQ